MERHSGISAAANNCQMHNVFFKTALILFPSLGHTPVQAFKGQWLAQQQAQQAATLTKQRRKKNNNNKGFEKSWCYGQRVRRLIRILTDKPDSHGLYGKDGENLETAQTSKPI